MKCCSSCSTVTSFIFAFVFIFIFHGLPVTAQPHSIWNVDILTSPGPPPDEGPPLSAGALRDKSKLKYEAVGIAGAYIAWLLLTFILLLFVGKRLRRKTQTSNQSLSMEILKPAPLVNQTKMGLEPPLKSPSKMASLRSWASGGKSHTRIPSNMSASTVDERILEADKARNLDEMTKLYAAVMAHDEQSQKARSSGQMSPRSPHFASQDHALPTPRSPTRPLTPKSPYHQVRYGPGSPRSLMDPVELQHLRKPTPEAEIHDVGSTAGPLFHPLAPTPAEDFESPKAASRSSSRRTRMSALSILPGRSDSGDRVKKRPSAISVRGQPISQPLGSATLSDASIYSVATTMSPRLYNPGPPPPTPGQKSAIGSVQEMARSPAAATAAGSVRSAAASNSSHSLPFRQFYNEPTKSAPATKTTFVDRRESVLGTYPKTGVPQTPYSPYMPFTPMTPVTPRTLISKKEMKKNRKKEGLKVLSEDDMVLSDEDMWGEMK
ncbi:hypothetical protein A1O1_07697 [Capronia coronata CBS 617.96]|uniref:Uncharacterized protein n=1 Tax=Capronia coronata CBS 617.96 TaxID=1182541 RepID=W9XM69_9EURO|nr:uncharacterized protein A1O1_07697 [Capronia coronata CBS 617.96]EXJ81632.1 hypothetical protein A1O1_07697 [Capronia coronata CBS 617.96]